LSGSIRTAKHSPRYRALVAAGSAPFLQTSPSL
jgi:hypothetical protein